MTDNTIVAIYETPAIAELAARDLKAAGLPREAVTLHSAADRASAQQPAPALHEPGFWATLFGGEPDHSTDVYEHSVAAGSTVVTVKVADVHADRVIGILESHHPVDIDEHAHGQDRSGPAAAGFTTGAPQAVRAASPDAPHAASPTAPRAANAAPAQDGATLHLAKEEVSIGKRLVNRGGTRIRRYVVETPVEEQVTLRDDKVRVDRRPVADGRTAGADSFADKSIEMIEATEEVVVNKTARVVEEVALRRESADRVETVRDTVRHDEVEVEHIAANAPDALPRRNTAR
jgi:uncharacterized protein (TIGR02271 family)